MFDAKNFAKNFVNHMGDPDLAPRQRGSKSDVSVPYNVINTSATETVVELSVAGFARESLQVTVELHVGSNRLHVEGTAPAPLSPLGCTVRQFSVRSFRNTFVLATGVEVERCTLIDGVMRLVLKSAASAPVRKVEIDTDTPTTTASASSKVPPKPEYLTERVGARPRWTERSTGVPG